MMVLTNGRCRLSDGCWQHAPRSQLTLREAKHVVETAAVLGATQLANGPAPSRVPRGSRNDFRWGEKVAFLDEPTSAPPHPPWQRHHPAVGLDVAAVARPS